MIDRERIASVQKKIVLILADHLEKGSITEAGMSEIAEFVLEQSDMIESSEQYQSFLEELAMKWSIFRDLYIIEVGQMKEDLAEQKVREALELTKNGKIEEALQVTKGTTY